MSAPDLPDLIVAYDLRDPLAWQAAHDHRNYWGKTHTCVHYLGDDHVLLVFRPAPGQRWGPWESVRRGWIERELHGSEAA